MTAGRASARPTKRAVALAFGALALFGVGTNVQAGWVLAIAALLVGTLVVGAVLPLRGLRGVEVVRRVPPTAVAGRPVRIAIDVRNGSRGARGLLRLTDEFCGRGVAVVGLLRSQGAREFASERAGARRGVYRSGLCLLETGAPFGVVTVRRAVEVSSPMVVHPRTYDVGPGVLERIMAQPAPAADGDVSSVREYRPGDPLRRIHWRSSARRGRLVVHELEVERRADLAVCVDVPADRDLADVVVSVACSIAIAAVRDGGEVALVGGADGEADARRIRTVDGVLDWGARLEPARAGIGRIVERSQSAGATVCVSGPAEPATIDALSELARRSQLIVVLVGAAAGAPLLRSAGAKVASVARDEVETWFASGCPAS